MKTENGKHTPGPWVAEDAPDRRVAVYGGERCVCVIGEKGFPSVDADAALIAAAPDMLEALRELLADAYLSDPVNGDRMASARAAVLKATGEEFGMPFTYPVSAPIWRDGKPVDPADVPLPVRKRIHWAARNGDAFIVHDGAEWQWD